MQIDAPAGAIISSSTVSVADRNSTTYQLNTLFQQALSSSLWHLSSTIGSVSVFKASHVRPIAWIGTSLRTSKIVAMKNSGWGDSWITVHSVHPSVLKRSQAWLAGWRATALNTRTGQTKSLEVVRSGLIQQVVVPPGTWQVHFHYHAPYIETSLAGTGVALAAWALLFASWRGWFTRSRAGKVRS